MAKHWCGHQGQRDLERAMKAFAAGRGNKSPTFPRKIAISGENGGGGNRTHVRGRTGQSLYKLRLRLSFARRPVHSRPTDGLAIL